jgi:hypothetical protein
MGVLVVGVGPVGSLVVFALPLGVITVVRVHRDAVVAVGRVEQAEMQRIFNPGRLVETLVRVEAAVGVGWEPVRIRLSLEIRVVRVVRAPQVDLQAREDRRQVVVVEVALGLVGLMRVASTAVLAKAMVARVGMLHQQELLAQQGLMQWDSYLHPITMLLTGGVVVVVVAAVPLIRVRVLDSFVSAAVVLETQVVVAAVVVVGVREDTEGAVPSGYSLSIMELGDLWWIVALLQVVEEREVMGVRAEPMVAELVEGVVVVPSRMAVEAGRAVRVRLEVPGGRVVAA